MRRRTAKRSRGGGQEGRRGGRRAVLGMHNSRREGRGRGGVPNHGKPTKRELKVIQRWGRNEAKGGEGRRMRRGGGDDEQGQLGTRTRRAARALSPPSSRPQTLAPSRSAVDRPPPRRPFPHSPPTRPLLPPPRLLPLQPRLLQMVDSRRRRHRHRQRSQGSYYRRDVGRECPPSHTGAGGGIVPSVGSGWV